MTLEDKTRLIAMRKAGRGYAEIAEILGISKGTVKTYCWRNGLTVEHTDKQIKEADKRKSERACQNCGMPVMQAQGRKIKKFCSDACRNHWWNTHMDQVKRKAIYDYVCPACGKSFTAYGNAHRKYCCHECYIADRFGGAHDR